MPKSVYSNHLRRLICHKICDLKESTSKISIEYQIPLKTVEKWVTAYNKNRHVYDYPDNYIANQAKLRKSRYDNLPTSEMIKELKRKDTMIQYLKSLLLAYSKNEENDEVLQIKELQI